MKRCCLFAPGDIVLLKFILRYANTELYAMKNRIEERAVDIAAAYHNFECYDILKEWGEDDNQNSWK